MKTILVFGLCCISTWAFAQGVSSSRSITVDFKAGSSHVEQAVETLQATNKLETATQVDYKAGRSVVLLPGFEAKAGALFVAHVGAVSIIATVDGQTEPLIIQAYPNPFDETTTISYTLNKAARVSLHISDVKGSLISQLVDNDQQEAGVHTVEWRGGLLAAGAYICTLNADEQQVSNRLVRK